MRVTEFANVGGATGGNLTFLSVDVTNTGSPHIGLLQIVSGGGMVIRATYDLGRGQTFAGYETVTVGVDARSIEEVAAYAGADRILCDKRWS